MKIFTRFTIILFLFILFGNEKSSASHVAGGEITWKCVGGGQYVFKVTIYRNCDGIPVMLSSFPLKHDFPGIPDIDCNLISVADVSPSCSSSTNRLNCGSDLTSMSGLIGSVTRYTFQSSPIGLVGVPAPPVNGYTIYTQTECCRPSDILNINTSGGFAQTLRAKMYGFIADGNTTPNNLSICFDNSPDFSETPNLVTYQYGKEYSFSNSAVDKDNDDLNYSFDYPLMADITDTAFFIPGYSITNPIPRISANGLNNKTGDLSFTPIIAGKFLSVVKVSSRKCGQIVSEIYRDITLSVINDPNINLLTLNELPVLKPVFKNSTSFDTTIVAGDTLLFKISVADSNVSGISSLQGMNVYVNGLAMGAENKSLTLCPFPPCAILNKDINVNSGLITSRPQLITNQITSVPGDTLGYGFSFQPTVSNPTTDFYFYWPTSCSNLNINNSCGLSNQVIYNFVVTAKDDYCLAPGRDVRTISVTLTAPNSLCFSSINQINKNVLISLSPNPANDVVNWIFQNPTNSKTYLEVYSITGQLLINKITNDNFLEIKNFDSGMYFLKINNGENLYSGKFIKE